MDLKVTIEIYIKKNTVILYLPEFFGDLICLSTDYGESQIFHVLHIWVDFLQDRHLQLLFSLKEDVVGLCLYLILLSQNRMQSHPFKRKSNMH